MIIHSQHHAGQAPAGISFPPSRRRQPTRRPTVVDRIEYVSQQFDDETGLEIYSVALKIGSGTPVCAMFRPLVFRYFALFQAALKSRLNIEFDDRGLYGGRRGQDNWETHLFDLLDGELP